MRRKLVKQGIDQVTLCLPIKWVRARGLKAGSEVEIEELEDKLLIKSKNKEVPSKKEISLEKFNRSLLRSSIASAYKSGYDEISITSKEKLPLTEINTIINSFTGLEIVSNTVHQVTIKSFLSTTEEEIEKLIIKLFQTLEILVEEIKNSTFNIKEMEDLTQVNSRKLRDHILRAIYIHRYGKEKTYDYYDLVTVLEKIAAELFVIGKLMSESKKKNELTYSLLDIVSGIYKAYLKKDINHTMWLKVGELKSLTKQPDNSNMAKHNHHLAELLRHLSSRLISIGC